MKRIFISYNWDTKKEVRQLCDMLESQNYEVWLDERELNGGNSHLTAELASAIKNSKVFLCCITEEYCKSYNCNLEVEYASAKKKPIIPLMIEKINPTSIDDICITDRNQTSGIGFIIT
jgi:hypothetical protein